MDYADSVGSSPRSVGTGRSADPEFPGDQKKWDDVAGAGKVRFMCSFGGKIMPRPHDNQLCYLGGDSRIVSVSRNITYLDLISKLSRTFGASVSIKYQLPNEDLDALISVTTDEDLENMMEEYDRLQQQQQQSNSKQSRLRIFLFPAKLEDSGSNSSSLGPFLDSAKKECWFVDALNGTQVLSRGMSEGSSVSEVPDFLFGFDNADWDEKNTQSRPIISSGLLQQQAAQGIRSKFLGVQTENVVGQQFQQQPNPPPDVHSAPDSPMLETSSYGSASSAHLVPNLPPVKVKPPPEEGTDGRDRFLKNDQVLQNPSGGAEGAESRYLCEDSNRGVDYRVNADGGCLEADGFFNVPPDIGLRTQDPRYFEDHIAKLKNFQKQEQLSDSISQKEGKAPASVLTEGAPSMVRLENAEKQIPIHEFEQLQIMKKQQQLQQERQLRSDFVGQEEAIEGRYKKSPDVFVDVMNHQPLKKDDSNSSLSSMGGVKRDGSQSSHDGDIRITNRQLQEDTTHMKQPERAKYLESGVSEGANPAMRDAPTPNLEKKPEEFDSNSCANYAQKDQTLMAQPDYGYVPAQYEQQYVTSHYVHQGQPVSYYQAHHDPQQSEQPYPVYLFPAHHHPSPTMQPMSTVVRPVAGQPGYTMPMPRNITVAPLTTPLVPQTVYQPDALSAKSTAPTMQPPTAPPLQKQPVFDSIPKPVIMAGQPQLRDQQVPVLSGMVPGVPRYRAPSRPYPAADVRVVYRPAPQVVSSPVYSEQQYAVQHLPVSHSMAFENAPQQIYYTQNTSIVNPPTYQAAVSSANAEMQSSSDMIVDGKRTRA
eukprot:TRINITY_DN1195_c0_g1_i1.p1 TRINITY_DN1195_c0_g1~~TRINITY_DN1195_c0_g1_i1.p1  ORF type:complete len:815 (+),score=178.88 TRINITY_DN1195_c0_g1_i1:853-3297(+)